MKWSDEDIDFLIENWGEFSMKHFVKTLKRNEEAISQKAYRLGLGPYYRASDYILFSNLLDVLGMNETNSKNKLLKAGIPVKIKRWKSKTVHIIYIEDFWEWAEKNKAVVSFSKLERNVLGKEPQWVNQKRLLDQKRLFLYKTSKWTLAEDQKLIYLTKKQHYTYESLAKALSRTEAGIKKRMSVLGIPLKKKRPLCMKRWTKDEIAKMMELYEKGYDHYLISEVLPNRTPSAIREKYRSCSKSA